MGYNGGCVYYANQLIERLNIPKEVWINSYCTEPYIGECKKLPVNKGFKNLIWNTILLFPYYLFIVIFGIIRKKYSSVIVFGPHNWDFLFLRIFKIFNKRAYYIVHDGIMHKGEATFYHQWFLTRSMKNASHLIFLSENVHTMVKVKLGIDKSYIVIPHGIIRYTNEIQLFPLKDKPVFLFIGRISYYKGINLLIEALPYLDFDKIGEIIIAGKFDDSLKITLPENNPKILIIKKWLSIDEFDDLINKSDFLLMPYLEASQSGIASVSIGYLKPAIVSRVGAMEEQFTPGSAYFIDNLNPKALAELMLNAIEQKDKYQNIQKNLQKRSEELSWDTLANKLENYINGTK
jgi:glycosyltransferase involved in cell wall biosynthesis